VVRFRYLSNYFKNIGKTSKSSVPVLSAVKPWFSHGFSRFRPIALEFWCAHAGSVHGVVWRLHFASRTENRGVFRVSLGPQNTGFLHGPVWYRSTPEEAVEFELIV
jgi:hypothetical protein